MSGKDARETERQYDRTVSNQDAVICMVSITTWDGRGEEFIDAVDAALEEVYEL